MGGNGLVVAVLRLPPGTTKEQARTRFLAILVGDGAKGKKK